MSDDANLGNATAAGAFDKGFLGPEFLTWLYFYLDENDYDIVCSEAFDGIRDSPPGGVVQFAVGKRTTLSPLDLDGAKLSLSGPGIDDADEVLAAVRRGALIMTLELQMAIGERVYTFTLRGKDGGISGAKLPDLGVDEKAGERLDAADVLSLRMSCLDEIDAVIDALYARFVVRRVATAWEQEDQARVRKKIRDTLRQRANAD